MIKIIYSVRCVWWVVGEKRWVQYLSERVNAQAKTSSKPGGSLVFLRNQKEVSVPRTWPSR